MSVPKRKAGRRVGWKDKIASSAVRRMAKFVYSLSQPVIAHTHIESPYKSKWTCIEKRKGKAVLTSKTTQTHNRLQLLHLNDLSHCVAQSTEFHYLSLPATTTTSSLSLIRLLSRVLHLLACHSAGFTWSWKERQSGRQLDNVRLCRQRDRCKLADTPTRAS